ncbi:MAG: hypothetical protein AAF447_08360 [Myxococcota bacterium]
MRDGDGPKNASDGVMRREAGDLARWAKTCREALAEGDPTRRAEAYLGYLERYPTGGQNRRAAEAVESLLLRVPEDARARVASRLRDIRQRVMPPVEPDTWEHGKGTDPT